MIGVQNMTPVERIMARIEREPNSGCWIWMGATNGKGYAQLGIAGKTKSAYKVLYESLVGPIPDGLEMDHLCRVRCCVNPAHMEPVTHQENCRRVASLITHCPKGHEFTPENSYWNRGARACRKCNNINSLASFHRLTTEQKAERNKKQRAYYHKTKEKNRASHNARQLAYYHRTKQGGTNEQGSSKD